MKKILSIFLIYGILSNVNAQGWSESFNIDATPTASLYLTSDMTWAWWGWGTAEIDNGVLTMVGASDPFSNNTCWMQIDQTIDADAEITPESVTMYLKVKFTTNGTPSDQDQLHVLVATDPTFLTNLNVYTVYSSPVIYGGSIGGYYFANDNIFGNSHPAIGYDTWFWEKIVVDGDSVSVWAYADGEAPADTANYTYTTDNVLIGAGAPTFIIVGVTDDDSSAVYIDEIHYNSVPSPVSNFTWHVSTTGSDASGDGTEDNPYATIQTAIDSSSDGDIVLVAAGTYVENINFNGKNIAVIGADRETTIIDGNQAGSVVTFESGEDSTTLLMNFTITNSGGFGESEWGGGIFVGGYLLGHARPILDSLIIDDNVGGGLYGSAGGGGLCVIRSGNKPHIKNSIISNTSSESESGALFTCWDGEIKATNCLIANNNTTGVSSGCASGSADNTIELINCTITDNPFGIYAFGIVSVSNSIIYNNLNYWGDNNSYDIINGPLTINNTLIQGGYEGEGNIDANPLFCNPDSGDYTLAENSPCVGTGENGTNIGSFGVGCGIINQVLNVPADYATIQAGIDATINGDTVLVAAGTYVERIIKAGDEYGNEEHCVIIGASGADSTFLIPNTDQTWNEYDGAIEAYWEGSLEVRGFTIIAPQTIYSGMYAKTISISNSVIRANSTICYFGGSNIDSSIVINNCTLINNENVNLSNNNGNTYIKNSIIYDNDITSVDENRVEYSLIEGYENEDNHIIDTNPLFCAPDSGDYSLAENSPCVGMGEGGVNMGAFDVGCGPIYIGPVWHVATTGSDSTGDGSEESPFATIQHGIGAASDGDTVLVAAGTYVDSIYYSGKHDLLITSELMLYPDSIDLIFSTIIQNKSPIEASDHQTIFNGFTITQDSPFNGGLCFGSSDYYNEEWTFTYCVITGYNTDYLFGYYPPFTTLENILITNNEIGGEDWWRNVVSAEHLTIVGNSGGSIGHLINTNINNSIFYGNNDVSIEADDDFFYSLVEGQANEANNVISGNPLFCNPDSGDYTLAENSPCVGMGEGGVNMGAFDVGCDSLILAPVILDIAFDQQIYEDDSLTIVVSATSDINASMSFTATSDTSDVSVTMDSTTLTATPAPDWNGSSLITVIVIDENELSDTTDFTLTVNAVNDSPEEFSVIYPTVSDTFSTHADNDSLIQFRWEKSNDVDSDVTYNLTIELEFFGNTYTDIHENISDTTITVSSNSLDALLSALNIEESTLSWYVESRDEEYTVVSDSGQFVLERAALHSDHENMVPDEFAIHQNYPNPFNPITTLRYDLPENGHVNITIYDMLGREVKTLINQTQDAGYRSVMWDATNDYGKPVSAGIYLYQIHTGEFVQTKKMVLLK